VTTSNPIDLAAEIVTSFVSNNSVARGELPALIEAVHAAVKRLADGGEVAPATIDPPAPAVSIRKSVTPDYFAPNYAAQRSALAKKIGFGLREKPIAATPPQSPG
jgi:predicted transcriptional regulator